MRDHIEGQDYRVLGPGESQTTIVCTDPTDPVFDCLADFQGEIVWRIQVRRGLAKVGAREVPATAVIGVKFSDRDIGNLAGETGGTAIMRDSGANCLTGGRGRADPHFQSPCRAG